MYIERRRFIRSLTLTGAGLFASAFGFLNFFTSGTTRNVTIFFPKNKNFDTFTSEIEGWMDRKKWNDYVAEAKFSGALLVLNRTIYNDRVVYEYLFRSRADLRSFVELAESKCLVNYSAREALGYSEAVQFV